MYKYKSIGVQFKKINTFYKYLDYGLTSNPLIPVSYIFSAFIYLLFAVLFCIFFKHSFSLQLQFTH